MYSIAVVNYDYRRKVKNRKKRQLVEATLPQGEVFRIYLFLECQCHFRFHVTIPSGNNILYALLSNHSNVFQEYPISEYCFLVVVWILEWSMFVGFANVFTKFELKTTSSSHTLWQHNDNVRFLKIHGIQECWEYDNYFHLSKPLGNNSKKLSLSKMLHILFFPYNNSMS